MLAFLALLRRERVGAQAEGIAGVDGVSARIPVEIQPARQPNRVFLRAGVRFNYAEWSSSPSAMSGTFSATARRRQAAWQ